MSGDKFDFVAIMNDVARELLGTPNRKLSSGKEMRYGTRGSFAVYLDSGTWKDWETGQGGGVLDLIKRELGLEGKDAFDWMRDKGFITDEPRTSNGKVNGAQPTLGSIVATFDYTDEKTSSFRSPSTSRKTFGSVGAARTASGYGISMACAASRTGCRS